MLAGDVRVDGILSGCALLGAAAEETHCDFWMWLRCDLGDLEVFGVEGGEIVLFLVVG